MTYKFIDIPYKISLDDYEQLTKKIINLLSSTNEISSIYSMGSIKNPGISDLDILCIFKNGKGSNLNIRSILSIKERGILTHDLFGICESNFLDIFKYGYFSNLKHLFGVTFEIPPESDTLLTDSLKKQIAIEYLIKMYITLTIQSTYGVVKLRPLLLEAKAIQFDLQLLSIKSEKINELVDQIIEWRNNWFQNKISNTEMSNWIKAFLIALETILFAQLKNNVLYLPKKQFQIARNITLVAANENRTVKKGIFIPSIFIRTKKALNFQNRLNSYIFNFNYKYNGINSANSERFIFLKKNIDYNEKYAPHFAALTTSLNLKDALKDFEFN